MKHTIVGVDLAKEVIQVCVYSNKKIQNNHEMKHTEFHEWLIMTKPTTINFEACGMSNYWKQTAIEAGHKAKLISAKLVSTVRQNQKTDKNDALAIVQASQLPDIQFIKGKSSEQQQLQTILRLWELSIKQKTASSNQIKALLLEFNIRILPRNGGLKGVVESTLEDAENGFCSSFRKALNASWHYYEDLLASIKTYDECLETLVQDHSECQ